MNYKKLSALCLLIPVLIFYHGITQAAWPTGSVPTTNLDQSTDSPNAARADTKTMADKVNTMITGRNTASGVAGLDASSQIMQGGVAVTSTAVEIGLLDGATVTTAEINELDESARAVTNFTSGVVNYIESNDGSAGSELDADAIIGATFESIGATGAGATNTWAAMDDMSANAKYVIINIFAKIVGASTGFTYGLGVETRKTGGSGGTEVAYTEFRNRSNLADNSANRAQVFVPVDSSGRFDLRIAAFGDTDLSEVVDITFVGWGE